MDKKKQSNDYRQFIKKGDEVDIVKQNTIPCNVPGVNIISCYLHFCYMLTYCLCVYTEWTNQMPCYQHNSPLHEHFMWKYFKNSSLLLYRIIIYFYNNKKL